MTTSHDAQPCGERIVAAARSVFAERGFDAPISEIADRAGVGVASIYRRFTAKEDLALRVRIESTRTVAEKAEAALASENDPWEALVGFAFQCMGEGTGVGTVLPMPGRCRISSPELDALAVRMTNAVDRLVDAAKRAGTLRQDVTPADIVLIFKHLNPPLPADESRRSELRARYLSLVLGGLRAGEPRLPGPAPDWEESRMMFRSHSDS